MKVLLILIGAYFSIYIWAYFSIFCHEMGHFIAAKIMGLKPYLVKIGTGKRMLDFKLSNLIIEFNLMPNGGITYVSNLSLHNIKPKLIFMYLAGPMINCFLLVLIISIYNQRILHYIFANHVYILEAFAIFEVLLIIGNLLPSEFTIYGQKHSNDGKQVLDVLTKTNEQFIQKKLGLARYTINKNDSSIDFFNNDLKTLQILYEAQVEFDKRNFNQAIKLLEPIVINERLIVRDKLYILDILVSIVIEHEQMKYLQKADTWSLQALTLAGDIKTIQGTRGAILIELGRYSEGKQMLLPLTEAGNDLIDIAYSCCYIAKADYFLGNENQVKDWLNKAKQVGVASRILLRIQKEINYFI
ncbi:M50 family metallopeptidase [Nostoc sp. C117]|uniref:M50 family metallopeptidase n=1 Tax=Nostoc sp. C117 TaxID=3349875 RepID=UPI00370D7AD2